MASKLLKASEAVIIASVIIIIAWLIVLHSHHFSNRFKELFTAGVVISPVPPVP